MMTSSGTSTRATLFIMVGVLLIAASGCGGRRSEQYTEQGNTYLRLGNVGEAAKSFARALELNPGNARAKLGEAQCLAHQKQIDSAAAAFEEAIRLNPESETAYAEAVKALLAANAVEHAERIAEQLEAVKQPEGGVLRAHVLIGSGRATEAIEPLKTLREKHPRSEIVRRKLASAYLANQQAVEAERELLSILEELAPDSLVTRMMLVEAYEAQGKLPEIETELRRLVQERPERDDLKLALARCLLASRNFEEAEIIARPILVKTPESPWANFVVGSCLLQQGKFREAAACLEAASSALPEEPAVAALLASARAGIESGGPAQPARQDEPRSRAEAVPAWQTLWDEGRLKRLLAHRREFAAHPQDLLDETLAMAAVFTQDVKLANELAESLPETSPVRAFVRALTSRDRSATQDALESMPKTTRAEQILHANAQGFALAITGARAQALYVFSELIQKWPDNGVAYYNVASMYRSAAMPRFAIAALQQLIARFGRNDEARHLLFEIMVEAGFEDEARLQAESTRALFPEDPIALLNLARAYRISGDASLALEWLARGRVQFPDYPQVALAYAEGALYAGDLTACHEALSGFDAGSVFDAQAALLAGFHAAESAQWDEVLRQCERAAGGPPTPPYRLLHAAALIRAGRLAEAAGPITDKDGQVGASPAAGIVLRALDKPVEGLRASEESFVQALKANPARLARYAYAMACREARLYPIETRELTALDNEMPNQPRLVQALLESLARARGTAHVLEIARDYTLKYSQMPEAWAGLADVCAVNDDPDGERAALEKAVETGPENTQVLLRYARFLANAGEYGEGLEIYRRLAALLPDDPYISNNLAYCLLQSNGDTAEALELATAAVKALGANPEAVHTLGLAQLRAGKIDEGSKNLSVALELKPGDPTMLLDFGKMLIQHQRFEEGKLHIRQALRYADQLGVAFPRRAEAEAAVRG